MANTKTVNDAITRAQNEFQGITLAQTDALDFANQINEIILKAAQWDFMTKSGTGFSTVLGQQDYSNVPADLLWLKEPAYLQDDSAATNQMLTLAVKDALQVSTRRGRPASIAVELGTKFRLFPVPNQTRVSSGPWIVNFEYYKKPTRLTSTSQTFEFDDMYFESPFCDGFIARVGSFVNDEETGEWMGRDAQGQFRGTGLWGRFAVSLNLAIASENRESGEPLLAPTETLEL